MPDDNYFGYDFGVAHPCRNVQLGLELGSLADTRLIDAWLVDGLGVNAGSLPALPASATPGSTTLAHGVLQRVLALYGTILRACHLPVFDPGKVLRLTPAGNEANGFHAVIALAVVDNVPHVNFTEIFWGLLQIVTARSATEPTPEAIAGLQDDIMTGLVEKMRRPRLFELANMTLCELAWKNGIPFRHLGMGIVRLGTGANGRLFQMTASQRDSVVGGMISTDKRLTTSVLAAAGLPAPENHSVANVEQALEAAGKLGWPVVVKPNDLTLSQGVTIGIRDEASLTKAFEHARSLSNRILVERHIPGSVHRFLVIDGKVIYCGKRTPKRVVGNGKDSIATLAEQANAAQAALPPWNRSLPWPMDDLTRECLTGQGMVEDTVLPEGKEALLRPLPSGEWGAQLFNVTEEVHPDNDRLAIEAAQLIGLTIAGVDIISQDISQPWHANGAVINEVNFGPQYSMLNRQDHLPRMMAQLIPGETCIPVHLVTGKGDLLRRAQRFKRVLAEQGRPCHLTTADHTEDDGGQLIELAGSGLFQRTLALCLRPGVRELVIAGSEEEIGGRGLAVDRLETLLVVDASRSRAEQAIRQWRERVKVGSARHAAP